jgi:hypothetical protein
MGNFLVKKRKENPRGTCCVMLADLTICIWSTWKWKWMIEESSCYFIKGIKKTEVPWLIAVICNSSQFPETVHDRNRNTLQWPYSPKPNRQVPLPGQWCSAILPALLCYAAAAFISMLERLMDPFWKETIHDQEWPQAELGQFLK